MILAVTLLIATITIAQNSLFSNISTTDQYEKYTTVYDKEGDGIYEKISNFGSKPTLVKFYMEYLPTGEGFKLKVVVDEGNEKDKVLQRSDAAEGDYLCSGYPYETTIKHKYSKDGFVSIGDYVFLIRGISADGTSFDGIDDAYIKKSAKATKEKVTKKKKVSFMKRIKALKNKSKTPNYGAAHKALQSQNLDKLITDYLVAMKAKQNARTVKQKQGDKNIIAAKNRADKEIKRYNDSIRATPAHKRLKAHQARMKQMDNNNAKKTVTINNRTGKDIYIYKEGFRNGTRINSNSSTKVDCSFNYTYKFDSNSGGSGSMCYSANSGCGRSVFVK